jgi:ubiquinone biosynthesis protein UbiJ
LTPSATLLNHLLQQNSWAKEELRLFSGKSILISASPIQSRLTVNQDGTFSPAAPNVDTDAEMAFSAGTALRMLFDPEAARRQVSIQGDTAFAAAVGKVLQHARWDIEEDLSRVIGDLPAHQLSQAGRHMQAEIGRQVASVAGMLAEYWLEEAPLIAKKTHLDQFTREVDALRDDAERLQKQLEKLESRRG